MKLEALQRLTEGAPSKPMRRVERLLRELFKKELKLRGTLQMTVLSEHSARYELDHPAVMDDRSFEAVIKDVMSVLKRADEEGHFQRVEDNSSNPAEVLLHSLRPGMTVKAEAFFPTFEFVVTWKQVTRR